MKDAARIQALYHHRRRDRGKWVQKATQIKASYNGEMMVPLPELDANETPGIANLVMVGIDQTAMRVASQMPDISCPPLRPGIDRSEDLARQRRLAMLAWWDMNSQQLILRQRARFLVGYGHTPVVIRPVSPKVSDKREIPFWRVYNPFDAYLPTPQFLGDMEPEDGIFCHEQSLSWLEARYPDAARRLCKGVDPQPGTKFEVLEYFDADDVVLLVIGRPHEPESRSPYGTVSTGGTPYEVLGSAPNRAGICPVVAPGRIVLDRIVGMFDAIPGMAIKQAKLDALEFIGITRGVFPEKWAVTHPTSPTAVRVVTEADGVAGIMGEVQGGQVQMVPINPGIQTPQAIDRLERNQRVGAGIPAEYGGECVDETTEILTEDGWKHHDGLNVGDRVLTLNHETGLSEWQPVEYVNRFPAAIREMVLMEGKRFSSLTTLNHRWPVVSRWNGARKWKSSTTLTSNDRIPSAVLHADLPTEAKFSDAFVEVMGWFYTEGSVEYHKGVPSRGQIAQSLKNADHLARIESALTQLFGPSTENWRRLSGGGQGNVGHDGVPRWGRRGVNDNGVVRVALSADAVRMLVDQAPGKVPTFEFLRSLTAGQLELFIAVSMWADNAGEGRFGQKDPARTEVFAYACILSGRGVSYQTKVRHDERPEWPTLSTAHIVRMKLRRFVNPVENAKASRFGVIRREYHDGMVWCPTTANGTWYARRKSSAYFTGNSPTNIRTARRGADVLGSTVDMPIGEDQDILARSLEAENIRAIATAKGYWGAKQTSFYVPRSGKPLRNDYTPDKAFETDWHVVKYSMPGSDAASIPIELGQRTSTGEMSQQTAREIDPFIEDPIRERNQVEMEGLQRAIIGGLEQQLAMPAGQGGMDPITVAKIAQMRATNPGMYIQDAMIAVHEQMQKDQAAQQASAQQQGPTVPGMGQADPNAQPGMNAPPPGAPAPATPPPQAGEQNLAAILQTLRRPANQGAPEQALAAQ